MEGAALEGIHSRFCCRLHHWPRAGAVGYDPPFVALGRWWQTRKGSCPNTSNRNLWQLSLPLTFSLPAACLTKTKLPGNDQNICQIPAVTCETGADIKEPWLESLPWFISGLSLGSNNALLLFNLLKPLK